MSLSNGKTGSPPQISLPQARRIALAAQGFTEKRPVQVTTGKLQRVIDRVAQFQIDTINIVQRAHYLPLFSRLGPYDITLLDRASNQAPRRLFEYWGHAASLIDVQLQPALRWRMQKAGAAGVWDGVTPDLLTRVLREITTRGPLGARQIDHPQVRRRDHWGWNWSAVKTTLEWLFKSGQVTAAGRNSQFERLYELPTRVLPAAVTAQPDPTTAEAEVELIRRASQALGIASTSCLADYFRISNAATTAAITKLEASGELTQVRLAERKEPWWLATAAARPRRVNATALISPFDSLIFERNRLLALFDYHYRIEIYVPQPKRVYGYYVYSFLFDESFAARVDLKAHRDRSELQVRAAWLEPHMTGREPEVAAALASELQLLATWLGLDRISVADHEPSRWLATAL